MSDSKLSFIESTLTICAAHDFVELFVALFS